MFEHSIKVPRLYKTAAKLTKDASEGLGSIKQLVYQTRHPNIKAIYALASEVCRRKDDIETLLKKSKLLIKEPRLDPWLAKVLIVELLWGKKKLTGESKPVKTILAYKQIFNAHLSDYASLQHENFTEPQAIKPRYVRINTIKISLNEAIDNLRDEGWILCRNPDKSDYNNFLNKIQNLEEQEFICDIHIPELLVFPPKTKFYDHPGYKKGQLILQDKASCLAAYLLKPTVGSTVLDMCAAPGMKTTQLAAAVGETGTVYAVDLDQKRFGALNKLVETSGATWTKTINRDVLTLTDKELPGVEYILVDPSCSGSGIVDRVDFRDQAHQPNEDRLRKLAGFQIQVLRHALTKFPQAKRVVYSTCSLNPEENEDVVRQVLETCTSFKLIPAGDFVNNNWINFGSEKFRRIGARCLYTKPDIDLTVGFFVAIFERLGDDERNEFLNRELLKLQRKNMKNLNKDKNLEIETAVKPDKEKKNNEDRNLELEMETVKPKKKKKTKQIAEADIDLVDSQQCNEGSKNSEEAINEIMSSNTDDVIATENKTERKKHKKRKQEKREIANETDLGNDTTTTINVEENFNINEDSIKKSKSHKKRSKRGSEENAVEQLPSKRKKRH